MEQSGEEIVYRVTGFFPELKEGGSILNVDYSEFLEFWEIVFERQADYVGAKYSHKDTDEGLIVTIRKKKWGIIRDPLPLVINASGFTGMEDARPTVWIELVPGCFPYPFSAARCSNRIILRSFAHLLTPGNVKGPQLINSWAFLRLCSPLRNEESRILTGWCQCF